MAIWRDIVDRTVRAKAQFGEPLVLVIGADMADRVQRELGGPGDGLEDLCRALDLRLVAGPDGACLVFPAAQLSGGTAAPRVAYAPRR